MAIDHSPPRLGAIVVIAAITVVSLIGLKFVFDSYFTYMSEGAAAEKLAKPEQLEKLHAEEQKNLTSSPIPIGVAMADLSRSGRLEAAGPELVSPRASDDMGPYTGWTKSPRKVELPAKPAAPPADLPIPHGPGDAGAAATGDAASAPNHHPDHRPAPGPAPTHPPPPPPG